MKWSFHMNSNVIVTQDAPEVKAEQSAKLATKETRKWTQKSLRSISRRDNKVEAARSQSSDWTLYA
jgi:hypothetical protein